MVREKSYDRGYVEADRRLLEEDEMAAYGALVGAAGGPGAVAAFERPLLKYRAGDSIGLTPSEVTLLADACSAEIERTFL